MASIAVALSGGVDSSVAAFRLVEAGHRVIAFSMRLYPARPDAASGCCSPEDFQDARRVATLLGIPYYVLNFEDTFRENVIDAFVDEYARGRTPSPCVLCNSQVKFRHFVRRARSAGAEAVATGHYARRSDASPYRLLRGRDAAKDQSYFLFGIGQAELALTQFPVGELSKDEVRAIARKQGLPNADKPESQEICFVEDGAYAAFVEERRPQVAAPGPIVDAAGRRLGTHGGIHRYTIGQRRGLGIGSPLPLFVTAIEPDANTIVVGSDHDLRTSRFTARRLSWIAGEPPGERFEALVKTRSRQSAVPAMVHVRDAEVIEVELAQPVRAAAPGQAAVLYAGEVVLGGGFIDRPA